MRRYWPVDRIKLSLTMTLWTPAWTKSMLSSHCSGSGSQTVDCASQNLQVLTRSCRRLHEDTDQAEENKEGHV